MNWEPTDPRLTQLEQRVLNMEEKPVVYFVRLTETAIVPEYKSEFAAGMDLHADLREDEFPSLNNDRELLLYSGQVIAVPTGLQLQIPDGWEGQIRPRSGLVLNHQLTVPNSPGTIDSDYRGEVKVILHNFSNTFRRISHGQRIAQIVFKPAPQLNLQKSDTPLVETRRGTGGFGSTGR